MPATTAVPASVPSDRHSSHRSGGIGEATATSPGVARFGTDADAADAGEHLPFKRRNVVNLEREPGADGVLHLARPLGSPVRRPQAAFGEEDLPAGEDDLVRRVNVRAGVDFLDERRAFGGSVALPEFDAGCGGVSREVERADGVDAVEARRAGLRVAVGVKRAHGDGAGGGSVGLPKLLVRRRIDGEERAAGDGDDVGQRDAAAAGGEGAQRQGPGVRAVAGVEDLGALPVVGHEQHPPAGAAEQGRLGPGGAGAQVRDQRGAAGRAVRPPQLQAVDEVVVGEVGGVSGGDHAARRR